MEAFAFAAFFPTHLRETRFLPFGLANPRKLVGSSYTLSFRVS